MDIEELEARVEDLAMRVSTMRDDLLFTGEAHFDAIVAIATALIEHEYSFAERFREALIARAFQDAWTPDAQKKEASRLLAALGLEQARR
ncbi:hypothetical protein [Methylocystis sp. SC2]|uniref:hypothetical protein n=1 Tax=Methylocystis sp. (strain SC2) TaxID=187303 RepID=UPI00027AF01A|nr:hypothetical protein [Methylocystis sp. SC2]CCJ07066.1 Hypothetical protein BN69_1615 [Methylocystis sp. SC2]